MGVFSMGNMESRYGTASAGNVTEKPVGYDFSISTFDIFSSTEFGQKMARDHILNSNIESYLNFWENYTTGNKYLDERDKKKITDSIAVTQYMAGYIEPGDGDAVLVGDLLRMLEEGKETRITPEEIDAFYDNKEVFRLLENVSPASSQKA